MTRFRTALLTTLSVGVLTLGVLVSGTTMATASQDGGDRDGGYGDRAGGRGAFRAASYINGDGGVNADVDPASSCFNPDQRDTQKLSTDSGNPGNNNVHNDACFLYMNNKKSEGPASFKSSVVGYISACPDPDGAGPKYAVLSDTNGDGRNDLCFQSGYQEGGAAGAQEFHARLNNNTQTGSQYVVWCSDADADGCSDEDVKDDIQIDWVR